MDEEVYIFIIIFLVLAIVGIIVWLLILHKKGKKDVKLGPVSIKFNTGTDNNGSSGYGAGNTLYQQNTVNNTAQAFAPQTNVNNNVQAAPPQTNVNNNVQAAPPQTNVNNNVQAAVPQTNVNNNVQAAVPQTNVNNNVQAAPPQMNVDNFVQPQAPQGFSTFIANPSLRDRRGYACVCNECGTAVIGYGRFGGYCPACHKWSFDKQLVSKYVEEYGNSAQTLFPLVAYPKETVCVRSEGKSTNEDLYVCPQSIVLYNGSDLRVIPFEDMASITASKGASQQLTILIKKADEEGYTNINVDLMGNTFDGAEGEDLVRIKQLAAQRNQ